MRHVLRGRNLWALFALVAAIAAPAAAALSPPTLTGEFFSGFPIDVVTASCDPSGTSTISYFTTGIAVGPYAGTYTESGTVTVGPTLLPSFVNGFQFSALETLTAFFTIDSPTGQVTGTKHLVVTGAARGACYDFTDRMLPDGQILTGTFRQVCACFGTFPLTYDATIETTTGVFGDAGGSDLLLNEFKATVLGGGPIDESGFNEAFLSSGLTTFPLASSGHVTGGGKAGSDVSFGLTAKSDSKGTHGECNVVDRGTNTRVKCLDATTVVQTGTHAAIFGNATVNGIATTYRIDVDDIAEPGQGADTFVIHTTSGYTAGGTLTQGNIQLH